MPTRRRVLQAVGAGVGAITIASGTTSAGKWVDTRTHPSIPGYDYVISVHRENICYWAKSGCIYWTFASLADPIPGNATAVGGGCAGTHAACRIPDDLERISGEQFTWIHVYDALWWNLPARKADVTPLFIPEGITDD